MIWRGFLTPWNEVRDLESSPAPCCAAMYTNVYRPTRNDLHCTVTPLWLWQPDVYTVRALSGFSGNIKLENSVLGWECQVSELPAQHSFEGWACHCTASQLLEFTPLPLPPLQHPQVHRNDNALEYCLFLSYLNFLPFLVILLLLQRPGIFPEQYSIINDETLHKNNVGNSLWRKQTV